MLEARPCTFVSAIHEGLLSLQVELVLLSQPQRDFKAANGNDGAIIEN